jgi:hypothetical protein
MQLRDVRMRQARQHPYLAQEAFRQIAAATVRTQQLQRLGALRDDVANLVHLSDAAMPERADHLVIANGLPRRQRHVAPSGT